MKIIDNGKYKIYIYKDHNPPHCHVYDKDGNVWIITIPDICVLFGGKINKQIRNLILENIDEIGEAWDNLN